MKVYIDVGANIGHTLKEFHDSHGDEYDYYAIECNESVSKYIEKKCGHFDYTLLKKAAWIYDGTIVFYEGKGKAVQGSTVMLNKTSGRVKYDEPQNIECMDLSKWIIENFKDKEITLKMDIEGAEYEVLPKMIKDGSMDLINEIIIEFHSGKLKDEEAEKTHNYLKDYFSKSNIKQTLWRI